MKEIQWISMVEIRQSAANQAPKNEKISSILVSLIKTLETKLDEKLTPPNSVHNDLSNHLVFEA